MQKETDVLVLIPREDSSFNATLDVTQPLAFVGQLLQFAQSLVFTLCGCEVRVPGLNKNNDQKLRTFSVLMQIANAVFGEEELDAIITDEERIQFIDALREKGFGISHNSKASVMEGIRIWKALKQAAVKNHITATRLLNAEKFAKLLTHQKDNKVLTATLQGRVQQLIEGKK